MNVRDGAEELNATEILKIGCLKHEQSLIHLYIHNKTSPEEINLTRMNESTRSGTEKTCTRQSIAIEKE